MPAFYKQRLLELLVKASLVLDKVAEDHITWLIEQELSRTGGDAL